MEKSTLQLSLVMNAPVQRIWEALTQPEQIRRYFFGTEVKSEWTMGSPITFSGVFEGQSYQDKGVILDIKPAERLRYSYWSSFSGLPDVAEHSQIVTYELQPQGDQTVVSVKQENIDTPEKKAHSEQGWRLVLEGLKQWVEAA